VAQPECIAPDEYHAGPRQMTGKNLERFGKIQMYSAVYFWKEKSSVKYIQTEINSSPNH
jgi:hypothetical protein